MKSFQGPVVFGQLRRGELPNIVVDRWLPVAAQWRRAGFTPNLFLELHEAVTAQETGGCAPRLRARGTLEAWPWRILPQQLHEARLPDVVAAKLAWLARG